MEDLSRNLHGDVNIHGPTRLHQGDNHHHYSGTQPQQDPYDILYQSLSFNGMDTRVRNVERALRNTCTWVHSHPHFLSWKSPNQGGDTSLLWIKGKPGSGKSTIMKEVLELAQKEWQDETILVFFFNARAPSDLEKSSLGLYRSVVHQLLSRHQFLRSSFTIEFRSKVKAKGGDQENHVEDWRVVELQNFILKLLSREDLPLLNIFIDALDEGDDRDVRDLLGFFRKASGYVQPLGVLRLCLSSRHYPQIDIDTPLSIVVEDQRGHLHDIETYIDKMLPGNTNSSIMTQIRATLLQKSQSIFLWVVLTISILRPLYKRGRINEMMRELQGIPSGLSDLFANILGLNTTNRHECESLLRCVLVAGYDFKPSQLYHAVQAICAPTDLGQIEQIDDDMIHNYIVDCSRGMVEIVGHGTNSCIVQFIHETVRQFLMGVSPNSSSLPPMLSTLDFRLAVCHGTMTEMCLRYILCVCGQTPLGMNVWEVYPWLKYAINSCWKHMAETNGEHRLKALDLAEELLVSNLTLWVKFDSILHEENPDLCTYLYCAVRTGIVQLCERFLSLENVNAQGGRIGTALHYAVHLKHKSIVKILIEAGAEVNDKPGPYGCVLVTAACHGNLSIVRILLDAGADVNANRGTALFGASESGHRDIVQTLLDAGADVNAKQGGALFCASRNGRSDIVQVLLGAGADVILRYCGNNALDSASYAGHKDRVQLLLQVGADKFTEYDYNCAINEASDAHHGEVMEILRNQMMSRTQLSPQTGEAKAKTKRKKAKRG